jgi:hypothetical protein
MKIIVGGYLDVVEGLDEFDQVSVVGALRTFEEQMAVEPQPAGGLPSEDDVWSAPSSPSPD